MKKDTKKSAAPKWGTLGWIMAHPYSQMDRKRRRRAEKAVDQEELKALREGPRACCLLASIAGVMDRYGVRLAKPDMQRFDKAIKTVAGYENAVYDAAFAGLLIKAWKIDAESVKLDGGKGFCR